MDLSLTPDQDALREATTRLYAKESHGERVREAEATGLDPVLWDAVVAMGLPTMALPEDQGGAGASLTDLAAAVEVHGAHLGSVPLVETAVVARLLGRIGAPDLLARLVDGGRGALCLAPGPGGSPTAYAAVADVILAFDGDAARGGRPRARPSGAGRAGPRRRRPGRRHDRWRAVPRPAPPSPWPSTSGGPSPPSPRPAWPGPPSTSGSSTPRTATSSGRRSPRSRRCSTASPTSTPRSTAAACSPTRRCGPSTRGSRPPPALAAQASWWCGEVADAAAGFSLHVHGGYGFMLEYDVQLHVRRAKATRLLLGDPRHELAGDRRAPLGRGGPCDRRRDPSPAPPGRAWTSGSTPRPRPSAARCGRSSPSTSPRRSSSGRHRTGTMHDWGLHRGAVRARATSRRAGPPSSAGSAAAPSTSAC